MKVKVKQSCKFQGKSFKVGEVLEIENAQVLIDKGLAEKVSIVSRKKKDGD
jgi:hypothetical protein